MINGKIADMSSVIILRYPAWVWVTEIDRCNIGKVRDFTIIIDEGRIINAVTVSGRVYAVI